MKDLQPAIEKIWAAWPTLAEADRKLVLAILEALADRCGVEPEVQS